MPGLAPAVESGSLLGKESAIPDVGFRAGKVDLAVRRVVIPHNEHRAPGPHQLCPVEYRPIEGELVADPTVVPVLSAPLGEVAVHNREPSAVGPEVAGNKTALDVEIAL